MEKYFTHLRSPYLEAKARWERQKASKMNVDNLNKSTPINELFENDKGIAKIW